MTRPEPLDDAQLDGLLGTYQAPPLPAGFADRVSAEATREGRVETPPPSRARRRQVRRPWTRRGLVAGVIAINLIVASAIAATLSGHFPAFRDIATAAVEALHLPRRHAASHHTVRLAHAVPAHQAAAVAVPPPSPEAAGPVPAPLFAERHPLMALRREGLVTPQEVRRARLALFARRHPGALARRAHLRALRQAGFDMGAPMPSDRSASSDRSSPNLALPPAALRGPSAAEPRLRLEERDAFERERRELEQRADAKWPAKPAKLEDSPRQLRDKPVAEPAHKLLHRAMPQRQWRERKRLRRLGHRR